MAKMREIEADEIRLRETLTGRRRDRRRGVWDGRSDRPIGRQGGARRGDPGRTAAADLALSVSLRARSELSKQVQSMLVVEMNAGQMLEDVRLAAEGRVPIHFYGRMGGMVPMPDEVLDDIRKVHAGQPVGLPGA